MATANTRTEIFQALKAAANSAAVSVGLPIQFLGDPEAPPVAVGRAEPYLTCSIVMGKPSRLSMSTDG